MSEHESRDTIESHIVDFLEETMEPVADHVGDDCGYRMTRRYLLEGPWVPASSDWELAVDMPGNVFFITMEARWPAESGAGGSLLELLRNIDDAYAEALGFSALRLCLPDTDGDEPEANELRALLAELEEHGWDIAMEDPAGFPDGYAPVRFELVETMELLGKDQDPERNQYGIALQLDVPQSVINECFRIVAAGHSPNDALKAAHGTDTIERLW